MTAPFGQVPRAVLLAIAVGLPGLAAAQAEREAPAAWLRRASTEQATLRFDLPGGTLRIPRNHLVSFANDGQPHIIGMAMLPDFVGARAETLRCFEIFAWQTCPVVAFVYQGPFYDSVTGRQRFRDWMNELALAPAEHGLLRASVYPYMHVFVSEEAADHVVVNCSATLSRCNMHLVAGGARWRVLAPEDSLPRWREIAFGLRDLIDRFARVPAAEAPR